jgi:microsomal dipeptidase-like Zn-dependent dipeptidase
MKLYRILFAALVLTTSIALVNCGEKTEKERAMDFAREFAEYAAGIQEEMENIDPSEMDMEEMQAKQTEMEEKMNSIAEDHGFENFEQAVQALEKFKDDPDMKELEKEMEEKYGDIL